MQNEPKFQKAQMNASSVLTKNYDNWTLGERGKNEPKRTQYKPKMNQNEPKRTQTNPISNPAPHSTSLFFFPTGAHNKPDKSFVQ